MSDAASFARNGANVFASVKDPSMSRPPRTGAPSVSDAEGSGATDAGWHAMTTTVTTTTNRLTPTSLPWPSSHKVSFKD